MPIRLGNDAGAHFMSLLRTLYTLIMSSIDLSGDSLTPRLTIKIYGIRNLSTGLDNLKS